MEICTLLHRVMLVHRRDEIINELILCPAAKVLYQIERFLSEFCLL